MSTSINKWIRTGLLTAALLNSFSTVQGQESGVAKSRTGLSFGFDNHDYGNNLNLTYRYDLKNPYLLYGGISFFIPSKNTSSLEFNNGDYGLYAVQYYAGSGAQRIGLKGGVERYIKTSAASRYELFWFYDIQYNALSARVFDVKATNFQPNYTLDTFIGTQYSDSRVSKLKNTIGGGIKFALDKQVYLSGSLGLGVTLEQSSVARRWIPWEYLGSIQLHYVFGYRK